MLGEGDVIPRVATSRLYGSSARSSQSPMLPRFLVPHRRMPIHFVNSPSVTNVTQTSFSTSCASSGGGSRRLMLSEATSVSRATKPPPAGHLPQRRVHLSSVQEDSAKRGQVGDARTVRVRAVRRAALREARATMATTRIQKTYVGHS